MVDSAEYIKRRVSDLTEDSEEIRNQADCTNDFDTWSGLKLVLHSAAVNMYTNVLENQDYFDDLYYIDALAGSGVSTYEAGNSCFLGSPIIAAKVAQEPFKKMYLIEKDQKKANALRKRMDHVFSTHPDVQEPEDWEVIPNDVNEEMKNISEEIFQRSNFDDGFNYFCFIDNQEMNVRWDTVNELLPDPYGDLLINLPIANSIGRNATRDNLPNDLESFYCQNLNNENIPDTGVREFMKDLYRDCLEEQDRPVQTVTNIDADVGSYEYDLIYATRETDGGSDYIEVIEYVKEFIQDVHGGDVENILDVLHNDQSSLDQHIPEGNVDDQLPDNDTDDEETKLDDFCD